METKQSDRLATHYVLVESKRGQDNKSFSVRLPFEDDVEIRAVVHGFITTALNDLKAEWRTGPDNEKHTHKIRVLNAITRKTEKRYVLGKIIHKPYHSSDEIAAALKTQFEQEGYA